MGIFRITKKNLGSEITTEENLIKLSNNNILKQYNLTSGFYSGITKVFPGSGYIDFHEGNIIVMSSRGILVFKKELEDIKTNFQQIKNNLNEYIGIKQFNKHRSFSIKDMYIFNNKIILSYTEEIQEDCWNTSLLNGDFNYENIEFEKLFSAKECIFQVKQVKTDPEDYDYTSEFNPRQSGGKIIALDDNNILLSIGEYRKRDLAQDTKNINGKIIKVNINNSNYEIISMGHRNPQGLYYDKEGKFILETEHGPLGGDEINLIEFNNIKKDKIQNFGWPISSAGEHYGGKSLKNKKKYERYPLYKSHSEYGFIEPLISFVPSISISEIVKIEKNKYVVASMNDESLYFFELNDQRKIINLERIEVYERVRDLKFYNNKLYLFMENSASIGVLNLKSYINN